MAAQSEHGPETLPIDHPSLDLGGTPDGIDHAPELGKKAVTGILYNAASVATNLWIDQFAKMRPERFVRAFPICLHQT